MLTGNALAVLVGVAISLAGAETVSAGVACPPGGQRCFVDVETPGKPAQAPDQTTPVSPGGARVCAIKETGHTVDCFSSDFGWFNPQHGDYYKILDPQPSATDPIWEGHFPDGAIYLVTGAVPLNAPGTNGGWTWLASPPDGFGAPSISPGELAARAVEQMELAGPAIGMTPDPGRAGLVGVPVWLWTAVTLTTWGPNSATASVPGLSVTATAQASKIVWDMGDGSKVTCANAGTAYYTGGVESPTCEHLYRTSSAGQPRGAYSVTATTTWQVTWAGGGASGSLTVTRASATTVRIGELQVLVTS